MKKILFILFLFFGLSSCWAPRCPVKGCQFMREHRHADLVTGTFSSRHFVFPRIHYIGDTNYKKEKLPDPDLAPKGTSKKVKKKYPWERW